MTENNTKSMQAEKAALLGEMPGKTTKRRLILGMGIAAVAVALGANIGVDYAVFEPVHGSAPDIKGQNKANPTALLLSAIEMLKYVGENMYAEKIEKALFKTLEQGKCTIDLGGTLSTTEFTDAVIGNL